MTRSTTPSSAAVGAALALVFAGSSDRRRQARPAARAKQDKAFDGALKFSKCMRETGIDMPDPQRVGTGGIKLSGGKVNFNDPKMKSAQSACQKYMQIGGGETHRPRQAGQAPGGSP